jgi:hypothetical protein
VVDAALGLQKLGHSVDIYTSHHDPKHCFEETRDGERFAGDTQIVGFALMSFRNATRPPRGVVIPPSNQGETAHTLRARPAIAPYDPPTIWLGAILRRLLRRPAFDVYTIPPAIGEETGSILLPLPRQAPREWGIRGRRVRAVESRRNERIVQAAYGSSGRMDHSCVSRHSCSRSAL